MEIVSLTLKASERAEQLCSGGKTLLLGVKKGGCAGMEYDFALVDSPPPGSDTLSAGDATIAVAPDAVLFLLGARLDWIEDAFSGRFSFSNPNQVSACGCGDSVALVACRERAP